MKKICVISVHPDDETLGCGGTLFKHKFQGDSINCVFMTSGNLNQMSMPNKLENVYGFDEMICLNLQENTLSDRPLSEIINLLSKAIRQIAPEVIYIPNRSDIHSDHRTTFEALMACSKSFRFPFIKKILMCEVLSETDFAPALFEYAFIPNVFVDISAFAEQKLSAINVFESELMDTPLTRSYNAIEALEKYRGSQINVNRAEAFMLIKMIE